MNTMTKILLPAALLVFLTAGCYTQLYRPEGAAMSQAGPYDQIYNRYDSTAIDTTLTQPETTDVYPEDNYGWSYWGRPRTRWGFDFYNFSPDYYWGYYGYYDYYSVPWWSRYYDPWYHWGWVPPSGPSEPPSRRDYGRRGNPGGGGSYSNPPPQQGGGSYAQPQPNPPAQRGDTQKEQPKKDDNNSNQRGGRRGR
jgi:hypothetical protein